MQITYKANGINFSFQTSSLGWREADARAEAAVNDPSKREPSKNRRGMGVLDDDPKPKKNRR